MGKIHETIVVRHGTTSSTLKEGKQTWRPQYLPQISASIPFSGNGARRTSLNRAQKHSELRSQGLEDATQRKNSRSVYGNPLEPVSEC